MRLFERDRERCSDIGVVRRETAKGGEVEEGERLGLRGKRSKIILPVSWLREDERSARTEEREGNWD